VRNDSARFIDNGNHRAKFYEIALLRGDLVELTILWRFDFNIDLIGFHFQHGIALLHLRTLSL
jgi:hypothetical protein